jgi:hypothetical protein
MTRPHERRFRQFLAQLKAGGAAGALPRARKPRAVPVPLG